MKWIPSERLKCKESKLRSRGTMLVRSPHRRSPKAESGSTSRPGRGRPTDPWLVGPIAQCYIKEVGATARGTWFCAATNPTYNPSDRGSTRAVGSATIAAVDVLLHHSYTVPSTASTQLPQRRPHRAGVVSLPLRQAEEAPATSTEEMANPSTTSSSLVDGRCSPTLFLSCC
jgi:hypothetical protein